MHEKTRIGGLFSEGTFKGHCGHIVILIPGRRGFKQEKSTGDLQTMVKKQKTYFFTLVIKIRA